MQSSLNSLFNRLGRSPDDRRKRTREELRKDDPLLNKPPRREIDTAPHGDTAPLRTRPKSLDEKVRENRFNKPDIEVIFFDPRTEEMMDEIKSKAGIEDKPLPKTRVTDLGVLRAQLKSLRPWFNNKVIALKGGQIVGTDDRAELIAELLSTINAKLRAISSTVRQKVIADSKRVLTINEEMKRGYRKPIQVIRQPQSTR